MVRRHHLPIMCLAFPEEEFEEDPQEEPGEEFEEDPEEELEAEAEEDAPPAVTSLVRSLITPPPFSESSSDIEAAAPIVASGALEMPPTGSTFEVGGPLSVSSFPTFYLHGHEIMRLNDNTEILFSNVKYLERCEKKRRAKMDANNSKIRKVKRRMDEFDQDLGYEAQFTGAWVSKRFGRGAMDARPDDGVDGLAAFRKSQPSKPLRSPSGSQ
ncbi:hypothetical protein Tco_0375115 [Tanacetum coccineum]